VGFPFSLHVMRYLGSRGLGEVPGTSDGSGYTIVVLLTGDSVFWYYIPSLRTDGSCKCRIRNKIVRIEMFIFK